MVNSLPSSNPLLQEKSHLIPSTRVLPPALSWNERCSSPHVSPATGWDFLVHPRWVFLFCVFVLDCNRFTTRCYFLLFSEVNQLCVCMYPLSLGPTSHLNPHPTLKASQTTKPSSLCCTAASHQLSILYMVVYLCQS